MRRSKSDKKFTFLQGRTNKLVDGCYSFWQGGLFPLFHKVSSSSCSCLSFGSPSKNSLSLPPCVNVPVPDAVGVPGARGPVVPAGPLAL